MPIFLVTNNTVSIFHSSCSFIFTTHHKSFYPPRVSLRKIHITNTRKCSNDY